MIRARGASDDKGQLMLFVEACRAWRAEHGELPCRITVLFEGEEESGSPSLRPFLKANAAELKADLALICDTGMWDRQTPAISVGLRGLVGEMVTIKAADRDLHSGEFGGAAANPIRILAGILADLHGPDGRISLAGFYDGVEETPPGICSNGKGSGRRPRASWGRSACRCRPVRRGASVLEMVWARPTAEVNGIWGGYTGQGFKTVIAAEASAKISFRLVHKQDPDAIRAAFRRFVEARLPADCSASFAAHGGSPAIQLPYDAPFLAEAKRALAAEWPKPAVMIAMGGSIPVVGDFKTPARHGFAARRLRPLRRPHPLAQREIRPAVVPQGAAFLGPHSRCAQPQADRPMTIRCHRHDLPDLADYRGRAVAIDTETLGLNPHRDRLCVVQLSPGDGTADIVQIAPGQRSAPNLVALLVDPGVTKLFHYGRFDIAVLYHSFGVLPEPAFCTKIASRLTRTYTDRHGLKDLCAELLGINLSKAQQSSDWAAESLTPEQLDYAASDVLYLHRLREALSARLAREGRTDLAEACFRFLPSRARLDLAGWADEDIFAHS